MRILLLFLSALFLVGCDLGTKQNQLPEGIDLIVEKKSKPNTVAINYQKYRLKNGLTVLLHQDKSDPLVYVDMTYHVGSAREEIGKSGFAHFFEHMMFQGSRNVADQQHFKLVTESGGSVNGTTNRDRTNYYQTVPANQLEKMLWLESDRMGFLLDAISSEKFEIQRATVKNERAQNYDNRPYGLVGEVLASAMFPPEHPYSWPTIGHMAEIDKANLDDLKNFFLRWYGPNNATLSIGGDIDIAQTLEWIDKYFSDIPASPEIAESKMMPVTLESDRFVTLEDKIMHPLLIMSWPSEYPEAASNMSLEMLAAVLGQGRNSLLYQSLVKSDKALNVNASQRCGELACTFEISVLGNQGQSLKDVYDLIERELAQFFEKGVNNERLEEIKGMAESEAIFSLESVQGKVSQLAVNQTYYKDPDRLQLWLDRLNAVNVQQVKQALNNFILNKPKVVLSVVPRKKTDQAVQQANYQVTRNLNEPITAPKEAETMPLKRETPVTFDRSFPPKAQQGVNVKVPALYRAKLDNGIELVGSYINEMPTVSFHLLFPAGKMMAPSDKVGLAAITARLIQEGSTRNTMEQIESKLSHLGSTATLYSTSDSAILSVSSLNKNLEKTLGIAQEILFEPRFNEEDFNRIKKQMLERMQLSRQNSQWLAEQAKMDVLYQDPWRRLSISGSEESIKDITLEDVKTFYQENYINDKARFIVVGNLKKEEAIAALSSFDKFKKGKAKIPSAVTLNPLEKMAIWLVDKPEAPQSVVQFVRHGIRYDALGELYRLQLANFSLAGNFNSRLNLNLREDKGYTYGANGAIIGAKTYGSIEFSASVKANSTLDSIKEIQKELAKIAESGFSDEEVNFMRLAIGQKNALMYETPSDKANLISHMMRYGLPDDFSDKQNAILTSIKKEELNALAQKWFNPNDFQIIVVGDAKLLKPELEKLNLPINDLYYSQ